MNSIRSLTSGHTISASTAGRPRDCCTPRERSPRWWWLFPLAFVPGYGLAWTGHFFIERNRPATFTHPLWSFLGDWKMLALMLAGKINDEVSRLHNNRMAK